jgi:hypothetical protein
MMLVIPLILATIKVLLLSSQQVLSFHVESKLSRPTESRHFPPFHLPPIDSQRDMVTSDNEDVSEPAAVKKKMKQDDGTYESSATAGADADTASADTSAGAGASGAMTTSVYRIIHGSSKHSAFDSFSFSFQSS